MKRTALAGTFALVGGAATLLLLASIVYSCEMGGTPHENRYNSEGNVENGENATTAVRSTMKSPLTNPIPAVDVTIPAS